MRQTFIDTGATLLRAITFMLMVPAKRGAPEVRTGSLMMLAILWLGLIAAGDALAAREWIEFSKWGIIAWCGMVPLFVCTLMIIGRPWPSVWAKRVIADCFAIGVVAASLRCLSVFAAWSGQASQSDFLFGIGDFSGPIGVAILLGWSFVAMARAGASLPVERRGRAAARTVAAMSVPFMLVPYQPFFEGRHTQWYSIDAWYWQEEIAKLAASEPPAAQQAVENLYDAAEDIFYRQPSLLTGTLGGLMPSEGNAPHFFFLAAAPYGRQDVFAREVVAAKDIFDNRFGTVGHSAILSNDPATIESVPLASVKNIGLTLTEMGKLMDRDKDIAVLFITSHGAQGIIAVDAKGLHLPYITPDNLAAALDHAGIKNRVLILSACHSGSFIPRLANDDTLIMTAASAERTSFGCGNGWAWTYFGDAVFNNAFRHQTDFIKAFAEAKALIEKWEAQNSNIEPSQPQIFIGKSIAAKLAAIEAARHGGQTSLTP